MGDWKKPKPTGVYAYGVMRIGEHYAVGIYRPGEPPQRVTSIGLRLTDNKIIPAVDRLNARNSISKERAAEIVGES